MKEYLLVKRVKVEPMTKKEYNDLHGLISVKNADSNEVGYLVVSDLGNQWLTKEQVEKFCHEVDSMTFSSALEWLKLGFTVARKEWKNDYVNLDLEKYHLVYNCNKNNFTNSLYYPTLEDLLAKDWVIVG